MIDYDSIKYKGICYEYFEGMVLDSEYDVESSNETSSESVMKLEACNNNNKIWSNRSSFGPV